MQTFLTAPRMYEEDENGERSYLEEDKIMEARSNVEDKIQEYCGAS